jgi:tetratricopeptide (TPR) repeat protein
MLFAIGTAHAQDATAQGKALYDEGLRHYNVAEYKEAIAVWKQAYLLAKKPLLLFNIGQAYRLSGDCDQALTFYDSYIRDEPNIQNQEELDQAVAQCKDAQAKAKQPPVDTRPKVAEVQAPPPIAPPRAPEGGGGMGVMRIGGIAIGATGVIVAGAGIYFALQSKKISNDLAGYQGMWDQPHKEKQSEGQRDATLGWALGLGGLGVAIAGGVMFALGGHAQEHAVAIAPTPGGATFAWGCSF